MEASLCLCCVNWNWLPNNKLTFIYSYWPRDTKSEILPRWAYSVLAHGMLFYSVMLTFFKRTNYSKGFQGDSRVVNVYPGSERGAKMNTGFSHMKLPFLGGPKLLPDCPFHEVQPYVNSLWLPGDSGCLLPCHVCAAHLTYCWLFQLNTFYMQNLPMVLASSLPGSLNIPHWSGGIPSWWHLRWDKALQAARKSKKGVITMYFVFNE